MKTKITGFLTISLISVTVLANDITNEKIPVVSGLNMKIGAYAAFESGFNKETHLKNLKRIYRQIKRSLLFITIRPYLLLYQIPLMILLMVRR